jgi:hypothetical protein
MNRTRDEEIPNAIGGSRQVRDVVHRQRGDDGSEWPRLAEVLERDAAEQRPRGSDRIDGDDVIPGRRDRRGEIPDGSAANLQDTGGRRGEIAKNERGQAHPAIKAAEGSPADTSPSTSRKSPILR